MKKVILACDPGSGVKSAFGLCLYNPNTDHVIDVLEIRPSLQKPTWKRLQDVAHQVAQYIKVAESKYGPLEVRSEKFIMRGLGGETLNRLIGAVLFAIPTASDFVEVHNIVLKRNLTGNARADKKEIGEALLKRFPHQTKLIQSLIDGDKLDGLDAIAIAICTERYEN